MSNSIDTSSAIAPTLTSATDRLSSARSAYTSAASTAAPAARSTEDTVQITGDAMQLQSLDRSIGGEPSFDSARVEALRAAIAEGRYQVDADRVADKMMGSTPSLF